jgi:hypothetical protein
VVAVGSQIIKRFSFYKMSRFVNTMFSYALQTENLFHKSIEQIKS